MADTQEAEDFLFHHGVKGQKWGVRKDISSYLDNYRWKENVKYTSSKRRSFVKNYVAPKFKALDKRYGVFEDGSSHMTDKELVNYHRERSKIILEAHKKYVKSLGVVSPSGKLKAVAVLEKYTGYPSIRVVPNTTSHSAVEIDEFLSHHGVKGQKWGVRNDSKVTIPVVNKTTIRKLKLEKRRKTFRHVQRGIKVAAGVAFVSALIVGKVHENANEKSRAAIKLSELMAHKSTSFEIIKAQESQRNGAFQIKKMLKNMGHEII